MGAKVTKANEWHIPVVNLEWLFAVVASGGIQPVSDYLVSSSEAAPVVNDRRKKNDVSDGRMLDITNNSAFTRCVCVFTTKTCL